VWTNVETIQLAGAVTLSEAQLDNDSTFELSGTSGTVTVTSAASVDVSNVTFAFGWTDGFDITADAEGGVIVGSTAGDTFTSGAAADTFTGSGGEDTFEMENSTEAAMDAILDYSGSDDIISLDSAEGEGALSVGAAIGTGEGVDVSAADAEGEAEDIDAIVTDGVITLEGEDTAAIDTLAEWIDVATSVLESYDEAEGAAGDVNEYAVAFEFGGSTYVVTATDDEGEAEDVVVDDVIKLTGVTGVDAVNIDTTGATDINLT
jgi:hypothetical protein